MTRIANRPLVFLLLLLAGAAAGMRATIAQPADAPKPGEVFSDCKDCTGMEMVVVPSGDFEMGGGDLPFEKPQHKVTIAHPFAIGRNEITFEDWDLCNSGGGCKNRPDDHGWGRGKRPVIDVSWDDAKAFLAWLSRTTGKNYRLPTEAEWEYAARAGAGTPYAWGRDVGKGNANCLGCGGSQTEQTMPSRSFRPNAFGLYDTSGNAAEWVEDCWNDSYRNAPRDGSAWTSGDCQQRVLRGGSFTSKPNQVHATSRWKYDHDVRYYANGFRAVRDLR